MAQRYEFYVLLARTISHCSCHSNVKFISTRHRVISSIYVRVTRTISHEWAKRTSEILFLPREHKINLFHTYWDFRIKFCVVKKRFGFYFDQSERRNKFLTREKIVSSNHKPRFKRTVFSRAFPRSSRVALTSIFGVLELFVIQTSKLSRARRYFWGWLNNQEDLCL